MSLRTVSFQDTYWSGENDLIKEFYVPCMEDSIEYYRAVGYFNSSILCYITNGLYPFIQNGGRMRIVCSVNLSPEDERQIALGYDIRQLMEDKIDPVIQNLIDLNIANIKNLCWLIKNNRLDIKVCLRKDPNDPGTYHLFHEKFGIFKDADGNAISFLGSVNETLGGWINNEESFEVSQNWIPVLQASVYKGYKRDKIEMRGDRAEMSDFPLYLNTVAGGLDCRNQAIGGFSFVIKIYALPVVEIIGQFLYLLGRYGFDAQIGYGF